MRKTLELPAVMVFDLIAMMIMAATAHAASSPKMPDFLARRDYPGVLAPDTVQVADTNGDGIPDVIADSEGDMLVLFGNGDGTFRAGPRTNTILFSYEFIAADLNGDGITDLVLTGWKGYPSPGGIAVCMGNGDGTFTSGTFYQTGSDVPQYLVVGDFNGDGILDVAAVGGQGVWLFTGQGGGLFNPGVLAAPLTGGAAVAAGDLNGDNNLDLVIADGKGFVILYGNGNGTFQPPVAFTLSANAISVAVGSLTKSGPPGIVVSSPNGLYVYFGNGAGKFSGPYFKEIPNNDVGGSILIGDLNGDGIPDLVTAGVAVLFGEGGGAFSKPYVYAISGNLGSFNANGLALADLANNGRMDIVTGGNDVSVLLNLGKGLLEDGIWTNVTGGGGCGVAADFNGDGKPDLAVNNPNGVSILLGTGKYLTPFTAGTNIALPGAECLVTGDINGDGIPDLLVPVNGTVVAYLGNGDGTFTLASTTPTPSGGYLALGDFNHDGKLDFATSGNLIALGNGDGTFQTPTAIVANPPSAFSGIAAGDINNDGWTDLVLTSNVFPTDTDVTVLLNNQQGGFTQVPTNFGPLTYDPILVDLNGDGNLDLVLSNAGVLYGDPEIYGAGVYLGDGAGGFTYSQTVGGQTLNPTLNLVADVNGDGIPDILELQSDTIQIFLGEGGAKYAAPFSIGTGPSAGSILVENLHGQSPKAGLPDIVEPDTSGGVVVLLNLTR